MVLWFEAWFGEGAFDVPLHTEPHRASKTSYNFSAGARHFDYYTIRGEYNYISDYDFTS
jgi:hypothetical protein